MDKKKKSAIFWLIFCIIWWISPIDGMLEAFTGPFALTDEVVITIKAFISIMNARASQTIRDTGAQAVSSVKEHTKSTLVSGAKGSNSGGTSTKNIKGF